MISTLLGSIQKQSKTTIIAFVLFLVLLVGCIDYLTGFELSFSVFYLIPISLVTWLLLEKQLSIGIALFATAVWLVVDRLGGATYSSDLIPYWNAGVRLGFFLIVIWALISVRTTEKRREELSHFIVHDLRSPLSNTLTGLSFLLDSPDQPLSDEQKEILLLSTTSANRMLVLINSLLDIAKLESGRMPIQPQPVAIVDLIDAAFDQVASIAMKGEVNLISEVAPGTETVMADRDLIVRVLINIIDNALKYSPMATTIQVRSLLTPDHQIAIQVRDQGQGIPKEWSEKVFSKFAQVDARKQGKTIGTGLGLTFSKLAIEQHGGHIWLTSEVGQGTIVTFTLPRPA